VPLVYSIIARRRGSGRQPRLRRFAPSAIATTVAGRAGETARASSSGEHTMIVVSLSARKYASSASG
jgi:hypothetical protein